MLTTAYIPVVAGLVAAIVTSLLVPFVERAAQSLGAVDRPGGRRLHTAVVPRLGGIAVFVGLSFGIAVALLLGRSQGVIQLSASQVGGICVATLLIFVLGVLDDVAGISTWKKFAVQGVAAWLVVQAGWTFEALRLPFAGAVELGPFGDLACLIWIVAVTNAINFVDGLDGLASGVVAIIATSFLPLAILRGDLLTVACIAGILGTCLGFLRHNWAPARIFMGDSGSLVLGFLLATLSVHSAIKAPATVAVLIPILAVGIPVIDTLVVMWIRFVERPKSSPAERFLRMFRADRNHLHHLLTPNGNCKKNVLATIYALVLGCCSFSLLVAVTRNARLGIALLIAEVCVVLMVRRLGFERAVRAVATEKATVLRHELQHDLPLDPQPELRPELRKAVVSSGDARMTA